MRIRYLASLSFLSKILNIKFLLLSVFVITKTSLLRIKSLIVINIIKKSNKSLLSRKILK